MTERPDLEPPIRPYSVDYPPAAEIIKVEPRDKLEELCIEGLRQAVKANKANPKKRGMTPEKAREYARNWFGIDVDFEQLVIGGLETVTQLEKQRLSDELLSDDTALD